MTIYSDLPLPPHIRAILEAADTFIAQRTFGGIPLNRETCVAAFRARLTEVEATIAAERLLIFDVAQGWEPLCAFLEVPIPNRPFQRRNHSVEFWDDLGGMPS